MFDGQFFPGQPIQFENMSVITSPRLSSASHVSNAESSSDLTTYTFSSQSLGAVPSAGQTRHIVVAIASRVTPGTTQLNINSVTIGGVSASQLIVANNSTDNKNVIGLYIAAVPTGTTGDIVVTFNIATNRCLVSAFRVINLRSATPTDTFTDTNTSGAVSDTVATLGGGVVIGAALTSALVTYSWTNLDESSDAQAEITLSSAFKNYGAGSNQTITATPTSNNNNLLVGVSLR